MGPISRRFITLSVGFNVEITLQSRDKRSASGGFAPDSHHEVLPLDPLRHFRSKFPRPQAPCFALQNWLGIEAYDWLMDQFTKQHKSP